MKLNNIALLVVDVQKGFQEEDYWGEERNNPQAEENIAEILKHWRNAKLPVFLIKHDSVNPKSPLAPGNPGNALQNLINERADEPIISKNVNSAFIGTHLEDELTKKNINKLVIVGLTTNHCVSTTTRMAGNMGYDTYLVEDATATYNKKGIDGTNYTAQLMHDTAIASLKDEFATILNTKELISSLKK
ncbi:cysteine hydrolase family protein [Flavobacteriaceae bacterium M23B6Z8]